MNIFVISTNGDAAGVPKHISTILRGMSNKFNFTVGFLNRGIVSDQLESNFCTYYARSGNLSIFNIFEYYRFMKLVRDDEIDIIHTHSFIASIFARILARLTGTRVIYTVHGWPWRGKNWFVGTASYITEVFLSYLTPTEYIFVSEHTKINRPSLLQCQKHVIIYNGVREFQENDRYEQKSSRLHVAMIARVDSSKDHQSVAKALEDITVPIEFTFVGKGTDTPHFKRLFEHCPGLVKFNFLGEVLDPYHVLGEIDLLVLMSKFEALPLSIIEAFSMKKSVLATRVGGIPELFSDESDENGYLIPPGDCETLRQKIEDFSRMSVKERSKIGQVNYERFLDFFTEIAMLDNLAACYGEKSSISHNVAHQGAQRIEGSQQ